MDVRPIPAKKFSYSFEVAYWIPRLITAEFLKHFVQGLAQKLYQKLPENEKNSQFLHYLSLSEETFFHEICQFRFKKVLWT